jgi:hypothetical protein
MRHASRCGVGSYGPVWHGEPRGRHTQASCMPASGHTRALRTSKASQVPAESAARCGASLDVPFAVVDLDEPDVLLAQGLADVHPLLVPADSAVAADAADLVVAGILQRLVDARYSHGERSAKISDHSIMIVDLAAAA